MQILNEAKEKLPVDYMTNFVSDAWNEVGRLKSEMEAIKKEFKDTSAVEAILQSLLDAYYIAIGQMQGYLEDEKYVEIPEDAPLTEELELKEEAPKAPEEQPDDGKIQPIKPLQTAKPEEKPTADKQPSAKPIQPIKAEPAKPVKEDPQVKESQELTESAKPDIADFFVDFDEPAPDAEADNSIREWLSSHPQN